jgi:hypothetical protein
MVVLVRLGVERFARSAISPCLGDYSVKKQVVILPVYRTQVRGMTQHTRHCLLHGRCKVRAPILVCNRTIRPLYMQV